MSRLVIGDDAIVDLKRVRQFIRAKNRDAAERMILTLQKSFDRLALSPMAGAPYGEHRRLVIKFGSSAYIAYYNYDETIDLVEILRIHHSREDIDHPEHNKL
ncbi:type II toxin-antitoxin system RelE/ParE family toxin [Deltaproteobacteria bacterium OttesenSCG-928-M10]|nr:type II toxin-antitoxin system RelE/ParE family toxin [Deltaproteobacteria bacterium OttesenSCG-928-M10]